MDIVRLQSPFVFQTTDKDIFFSSLLRLGSCRKQTTKSQKRFLISRPGVYFSIIPVLTLLTPTHHQTINPFPAVQGDVSGVLKRSGLDTPKWMNVLLRKRSIYHSVPFAKDLRIFYYIVFVLNTYKEHIDNR